MIDLQVARLNIKEEHTIGLRRITIMVLAGKFNQFPRKIGIMFLKESLMKS